MKKLLYFFAISWSSLFAFGQDPDPDLFQTWYLYSLDIDLGMSYEIGDIDPAIAPFLTIEETFDFNGQGACNSFNGVYDITGNIVLSTDFNNTTDDCGVSIHNSFEVDYFEFLQGYTYEITNDTEGQVLTLENPLQSVAILKNYPLLSSSDINLNRITIYPNPSNSEIFIESQQDIITRVEIFNLLGEKLQTVDELYIESIDISSLTSGVYLLKLFSEKLTTVKKVVKK